MKRLRDDMYDPGGSHHRRSFVSSLGESYGQLQFLRGEGSGASQKLTTSDALAYLREVKNMFHDQREKYNLFLEVMKNFKAHRIDTDGAIAQVKELFIGHKNLILGFSTFLPKGYEISPDEEETPPVPKKTVEFREAIGFVSKIKRRFQNNERVYKSFLDVISMCRREHKDIFEAHHEVSNLFKDHPDLLDEFTRFLPEASAQTSGHDDSYGRKSLQQYNERSSAGTATTMRRVYIDKLHQCDLSVDHSEMEENKTKIEMNKDQRRLYKKESRDKRYREKGDGYPDNGDIRDLSSHPFPRKRKSVKKVERFGASYEEEGLKSTSNYAATFFEKVKEKLGSLDDYQSFLKCINLYNNGIIKRNDLQNSVTDFLGTYPDLMNEFNDFLESCGNIESVYNGEQSSGLVRVEKRDKEQKYDNEQNNQKERHKDKYMGKSMKDLDLSSCACCTPSYRLLPADYPISSASERTELDAHVLNDCWVSATSRSKDYSFKHMPRNQYEESLFRCEDDRFELDMLLESVSSTVKQVEEMLSSISESKINEDNTIRLEDHFTALNLKFIKRLYGEHSVDVIDILRKSPAHVLPVIFTRLKQKQEDWMESRLKLNKIWAEVYAKNYYRSLDYRTFYFKQQDSKNLNTKSLVAEIKELNEKREDDGLINAVAARERKPLVPHLEYEYSDNDIHEDLYRLVEFSCKEVCSTKEQFHKVMTLWTTFLEPMLGVPFRPYRRDSDKEVGKADPLAVNCPVSGIKDSSRCPDGYGSGDASSEQFSFCMTNCENQDSVAKEGCALTPSGCAGLGNGDHELKTISNSVPLSKDGEAKKSFSSANEASTEGLKVDRQHVEAPVASIVEKEEGELSPNGDFEENNPVDNGNAGAGSLPMYMLSDENRKVQSHSEEEWCADADDEQGEKVFEAGEDALASESAVNECSREEHEMEDIKHDEDGGKTETEDVAEMIPDGHVIGEESESLSVSERFISVRPLVKHLSPAAHDKQRKDSRIFYGNDDFYVLFRLHQILYERILQEKRSLMDAETKSKNSLDDCAPGAYARFQSALYHLLDGSIDGVKFEDECRALTGNQAYVLSTLDKLVYKLVKQLQTVASDEMDIKLSQLYSYEKSRKVGKLFDSVYYENSRVLLHEQNIYRMECLSSPSQLSIQLMDNKTDKPEVFAVSSDLNFTAYLYNDYVSVLSGIKEPSGFLLKRNKRKYAGLDELSAFLMAMEGVQMVNGLECNIACSSCKVSYVIDTEDCFIRKKKQRKIIYRGLSPDKNKRQY